MVYRLASATVTPLQLQRENERIATSRRKITKSGKSQQSWVQTERKLSCEATARRPGKSDGTPVKSAKAEAHLARFEGRSALRSFPNRFRFRIQKPNQSNPHTHTPTPAHTHTDTRAHTVNE